jgi:hypothetical protein
MARRYSGLGRWLAVAVTAVLVAVPGCTTTLDGAAVKAKETDTANVALMDTGTYPTTLGHIFGTAGADTYAQNLLEAHRLADLVTGPWQVDETLTQHPFLELLIQIQAITDANYLGMVFGAEFSGVAAKHGYITGVFHSAPVPRHFTLKGADQRCPDVSRPRCRERSRCRHGRGRQAITGPRAA